MAMSPSTKSIEAMIMVSVLMPVRPVPLSAPNSIKLRRPRPSHGTAVVVVVGMVVTVVVVSPGARVSVVDVVPPSAKSGVVPPPEKTVVRKP